LFQSTINILTIKFNSSHNRSLFQSIINILTIKFNSSHIWFSFQSTITILTIKINKTNNLQTIWTSNKKNKNIRRSYDRRSKTINLFFINLDMGHGINQWSKDIRSINHPPFGGKGSTDHCQHNSSKINEMNVWMVKKLKM